MKFEARWLAELLDAAPPAAELAARLTDCGLLVELREQGDGSEVWDVEVTTNRPDAMNHRGLAREAAVATGSRLRPLEFELAENGDEVASLAAVEIAAGTPCSRYVARVIRGVRVGPSPEWLQRRLSNCGVRPINSAVDATNYVLLELGQPLHAFDLGRLRGRRVVVRPAAKGERLTTLDGVARELDPSMMVIADETRAVALAGIMGGAETEIHAGTTEVLLESACFDALSVRRTARRLGMHTEASHRFERGADPEIAAVACDRAAHLIAELAGGELATGRIDVWPRPWQPRRIELSVAALAAFAGLEIPAARVEAILGGLGFAPARSGDTVRVAVPAFRVDVERVADLYEEVLRHVGYGAVPAALPVLPTAPGKRHPNWQLVDRARDAALAAGLAEVVTWSFIDPGADRLVASQPLCPGPAATLANPLATTQSVLRRSLLPGLLSAAQGNLNQGERSLALFEQGRVFAGGAAGPSEPERLGIVLRDDGGDAEARFRRLKGVVEHVGTKVGLPALHWRAGGNPWLDETAGAILETADGRAVGLAGLLAPEIAAHWDLGAGVAVAELALDTATAPPLPRFAALARFPPVVMDMTVEHGSELGYAGLEAATRELAGEHVEGLGFVTRYHLPDGSGRVRTTLRLVYRHAERSLTQDEVNAWHADLRRGLAERLGVGFA
ncbi:MAG: phenylalanine--tRNA ligase subunit beta [Thermoanaerobaculales bacterium]|nr:phenylalanine--tRNA ligase subunit beta [Thermoanaerobaculales bacterium]